MNYDDYRKQKVVDFFENRMFSVIDDLQNQAYTARKINDLSFEVELLTNDKYASMDEACFYEEEITMIMQSMSDTFSVYGIDIKELNLQKNVIKCEKNGYTTEFDYGDHEAKTYAVIKGKAGIKPGTIMANQIMNNSVSWTRN